MTKNNDDKKNIIEPEEASDEVEEVLGDEEGEDVQQEQIPVSGSDNELEELKQRIESLESQLRRAVADYQNLEKRIAEGRHEFASWASGELIKKLVPVLDHLEKALNGAQDEEKKSGWFRGVEMSVKSFKQVLKEEGLEQIEVDAQFDPLLHEAVDTRDGENDKILEVVENGYRLDGKVLRPAKVVVGRRKES